MNKWFVLVIIFLLFTGCVPIESKVQFVEQEIRYQIWELEDDLDIDIKYSFNIVDIRDSKEVRNDPRQESTMARCVYFPRKMLFDRYQTGKYHNTYGIENYWPLILHEIGHCTFGLKHREVDENGKVHIMATYRSYRQIYEQSQDREYYLDQFRKLITPSSE